MPVAKHGQGWLRAWGNRKFAVLRLHNRRSAIDFRLQEKGRSATEVVHLL